MPFPEVRTATVTGILRKLFLRQKVLVTFPDGQTSEVWTIGDVKVGDRMTVWFDRIARRVTYYIPEEVL